MIRRMAGLVVLALAIIIVVFYGLLQFLLRHGSNYSVTFSAAATALTALLTAAAVVAAVVYMSLTYRPGKRLRHRSGTKSRWLKQR